VLNPSRSPYNYEISFTTVSEKDALRQSEFLMVGEGMLNDLKK
jgi:hypothetical protein